MKNSIIIIFMILLVSHSNAQPELWGGTFLGGQGGVGVIFSFDVSTKSFRKKLDLDDTIMGRHALGSFIQATNYKLYGAMFSGGSLGSGVLLEYDLQVESFRKVIDFDAYGTGSYPNGPLIQAKNGKIYGMTRGGGYRGYGAIYEFDPLYSTVVLSKNIFSETKGKSPYGGLEEAEEGKLYGMTRWGGEHDCGILFEYDVLNDTLISRVDFIKTINGCEPQGSLVAASNGKLYGMTYLGGKFDKGVLFEYDPLTFSISTLIDFQGEPDGGHPLGSLIQASNGKLYGLTLRGGVNNDGTIFEYDILSQKHSVLYSFKEYPVGDLPSGALLQASNGMLYGTSRGGKMERG